MEIIKPGILIDFMRYRRPAVIGSLIAVGLTFFALLVYPGPKLGIDFAGGTEVQLAFKGDVDAGELRETLIELGYAQPSVINVEGAPNQYMIRLSEVSPLSDEEQESIREQLTEAVTVEQLAHFKFSPGGDKITFALVDQRDLDELNEILAAAGANVRTLDHFSGFDDHRYEAHLVGIGDELITRLRESFGERGPDAPLRVEWVGPRAGEQLRDSAIMSILYSIAFIMVYVAFRFDLRYAPGAIVGFFHDVFVTFGVYVLFQREVSLTTVAALLTVLAYSINDTIVIYDRIRENASKHRDKSMSELINLSTSQVLSRTIVTSTTTILAVIPFFYWGTSTIQDIAFTLVFGIIIGTYSSIFISAPVTELIDRRFFQKPEGSSSSAEASATA